MKIKPFITIALVNMFVFYGLVNLNGLKQPDFAAGKISEVIEIPQSTTKSVPSPTTIPVRPTVANSLPKPTETVAPPAPAAEKCIVTVRGVKYDLTQFRYIHSGGNIFKCGGDMTTEFNSQHGDAELQVLQKYKI